MIVESIGVAQVENPVASTIAEDNTLQTSMAQQSIVKFVPAVVTSEAAIVTILEVSVITFVSKEPVVGHVPALSEMTSASTETIHTII